MPATPKHTIDMVLQEFLDEQKSRVSMKTVNQYAYALSYFRLYVEAYWPGHDGEYARMTKAGGAYCDSYGPEDILTGCGEFLGYYMPRKAMCGKQTMRAAGTVMKKLALWLRDKGYVAKVDLAVQTATRAAKELPAAIDALRILEAYVGYGTPGKVSYRIEDHFTIVRLEPGKIWLQPVTYGGEAPGPVPVPPQATARLKVGWDIGGVVGRTSCGPRLLEVWNVSP